MAQLTEAEAKARAKRKAEIQASFDKNGKTYTGGPRPQATRRKK